MTRTSNNISYRAQSKYLQLIVSVDKNYNEDVVKKAFFFLMQNTDYSVLFGKKCSFSVELADSSTVVAVFSNLG